MINKKGTHVGVVLSFVVFVSFMVFLYTALQPAIEQDKSKQVTLDFLKGSLLDDLQADLTTAILNFDFTEQGEFDCISFEEPGGIDKIYSFSELVGGGVVPSSLSTQTRIVKTELLKFSLKNYYSDEVLDDFGAPTCEETRTLTKDTDYTVALVRTEQAIFESKIEKLGDDYDSNYDALKETLGIPPGTEFAFKFVDGNDEIVVEKAVPDISTSIYADEIPIQYLDSTANLNSGFLTISIW